MSIPQSTIELWARLVPGSPQELALVTGIGEALIYDASRKMLTVGRCETHEGREVVDVDGGALGMTAIMRCPWAGILCGYVDPLGREQQAYMCPRHGGDVGRAVRRPWI